MIKPKPFTAIASTACIKEGLWRRGFCWKAYFTHIQREPILLAWQVMRLCPASSIHKTLLQQGAKLCFYPQNHANISQSLLLWLGYLKSYGLINQMNL